MLCQSTYSSQFLKNTISWSEDNKRRFLGKERTYKIDDMGMFSYILDKAIGYLDKQL